MASLSLKINYSDEEERRKAAKRIVLSEATIGDIEFFDLFSEHFDIILESEAQLGSEGGIAVPTLLILSFAYCARLIGKPKEEIEQFIGRFCLKGFQMQDAWAEEKEEQK